MKRILNIIISSFLIIFAWQGQVFGQEVNYPPLPGPEGSVLPGTFLLSYINYFFYFILGIAGLLAIVLLVLAGINYLISTGNPEKVGRAKKQLFSTILGFLILLGSFLILNTINPQLTKLNIILPSKIPSPPARQESPLTPEEGDSLDRLKKMGERIKELLSDNIQKSVQDLKKATDDCACKNTNSLCYCKKAEPNSSPTCQPGKCYAGPDSNPCKNTKEDIENSQHSLVWAKDVLLYYKNRSVEEKKDLEQDITRVIDPKIQWLNKAIAVALQNLKAPEAKEFWTTILNELKKQQDFLMKEKGNKTGLLNKLDEINLALAPLIESVELIVKLPDNCFSEVENKCQATCKEGPVYGCNNEVLGCQPGICKAKEQNKENPCPTEEIESSERDIQNALKKVLEITNQIIQIVNSIKPS